VEEGQGFSKKYNPNSPKALINQGGDFFENPWQVRGSDSDPCLHADLVLHGTVQYLCGRVRMSIFRNVD
jgi:hypothetical protein